MKKLILLFAIVIVALTSCNTAKRFERLKTEICPYCEKIVDTVVTQVHTRDTLIKRDTVFTIQLLFDTIYKETPVYVNSSTGLVNSNVLTMECEYAIAKSWVENSKLKGEMFPNDSLVKIKVKDAIKIYISERDSLRQIIVSKQWSPKLEPTWWEKVISKSAIFISGALFGALVALILFMIFRKNNQQS